MKMCINRWHAWYVWHRTHMWVTTISRMATREWEDQRIQFRSDPWLLVLAVDSGDWLPVVTRTRHTQGSLPSQPPKRMQRSNLLQPFADSTTRWNPAYICLCFCKAASCTQRSIMGYSQDEKLDMETLPHLPFFSCFFLYEQLDMEALEAAFHLHTYLSCLASSMFLAYKFLLVLELSPVFRLVPRGLLRWL